MEIKLQKCFLENYINNSIECVYTDKFIRPRTTLTGFMNAVCVVNGFCDICAYRDKFDQQYKYAFDLCYNVSKQCLSEDNETYDDIFYILFSKKYRNKNNTHTEKYWSVQYKDDTLYMTFIK